jgi:tRNA threonylcarbamoyladenosine biosynthesis protein TsaE
MHRLRYLAASLEDTGALAGELARHLRPGDAVLLTGKLGAGKTAFVQQVVADLGYPDQATSPTFTLANFYQAPRLTVLHVDAYRLESIRAFRDLGLAEYYDECLTIVEWGDKVEEDFEDALRIDISFSPESEDVREFSLSADGPRWATTFEELRHGRLSLVTIS